MNDVVKHEALDRSIDRVVFGGDVASSGDEDLDALSRLASGLRGLADPRFKTRLREELAGERDRGPAQLKVLFASWLHGQRAFLAAGSSSGLVAGTCCVSGATAHVLGLASAAAVTAFIHSTIPYFIALSIVGLLGWMWWTLRERGITPATIGETLRHHGLALGSGYAALFAATMSLSMVMGLY
jgi:hypothetical protein